VHCGARIRKKTPTKRRRRRRPVPLRWHDHDSCRGSRREENLRRVLSDRLRQKMTEEEMTEHERLLVLVDKLNEWAAVLRRHLLDPAHDVCPSIAQFELDR